MSIPRFAHVAAFAFACMAAAGAAGQEQHRQHARSAGKAPVFVASTAKPYAALVDDAMAVMDEGMRSAPMTGAAEHDFVTMMIPHHQGAIDMAKALLLTTRDPELRNIAQGIITEQQNEIKVMQAWLQRYQAAHAGQVSNPNTKKD
jgi:uncharacterized protein (DUF305 family)